MKKKTIILLAPKRTGTTAILNVFRNHSQVKIAHHNQNIENWEPQYWNLAFNAINNNDKEFKIRIKKAFPKLDLDQKFNKKKIFNIWNEILENYGPCLFDKSPQYLNNYKVLELINDFKMQGNDVRFFSLIRNPKDALTSQHQLWKEYTGELDLNKREKDWLRHYSNIEKFREKSYFNIYKYEEITNRKNFFFKKIFKDCGLTFEKKSFESFRAVSINRYNKVFDKNIENWRHSYEFNLHLKKYRYDKPNLPESFLSKFLFALINLKRLIPLRYKLFLKSLI